MPRDKKQMIPLIIVIVAIVAFSFYRQQVNKPDANSVISVEFVDAAYVDEVKVLDTYTDIGDEKNMVNILLTFNTSILNYWLLGIDAEIEEDGSINCISSEELYNISDIPARSSIMIKLELPETVPERAIRVTDSNHNTFIYYLMLSGKDNVPMLMHADLK